MERYGRQRKKSEGPNWRWGFNKGDKPKEDKTIKDRLKKESKAKRETPEKVSRVKNGGNNLPDDETCNGMQEAEKDSKNKQLITKGRELTKETAREHATGKE